MSDLKPIQGLRPFTKFCMTIGNLPASYLASMTYEEQLLWFCDYLQNTVIPTVNNNAEAVEELQNLYVQLKNYVDHYFDNLDVQNEINNKLDDMASDGTLENIINQQLFNKINNNIQENSKNINILKNSSYINNGLSIHLSFDDVQLCLNNLINNNYSSIFEEPFFNLCKYLHDNFNACISLYVFTDIFNNLPNTFKNEFRQNSNWLKFGFHSLNSNHYLTTENAQQYKSYYDNFVNNLIRICGTSDAIDRVPRLNYYSGNIFALSGTLFSPLHPIGYLDADDDRKSYLHNSLTLKLMNNNNLYFDGLLNLFFIKTNLKIENSTNLENDLINILNKTNTTNQNIEIFTHEVYVYDGSNISNKDKLETVCNFANTNNIPFNFVQNKIPDLTSCCLNQDYTLGVRSSDFIYNKNCFSKIIKNTLLGNLKKYICPDGNGGTIKYNVTNFNFGLDGYFLATTNKINITTNLSDIQVAFYEYNSIIPNPVNHRENTYSFNQWYDLSPNIDNIFNLQDDTLLLGIVFKTKDERQITDDMLFKIDATNIAT